MLSLHQRIQETFGKLAKHILSEKLSALSRGEPLPAFPDLHLLSGACREEHFSNIVRATIKLEKVEAELKALDRQLQELKVALPSPLNANLEPTVEGLEAAIKMIEAIGALDSRMISLRSEHFDEDDLDATLEALVNRPGYSGDRFV